MKKALFVLLFAAAAFVGCQKTAEVAVPAQQDQAVTTATDTAPATPETAAPAGE